MCLDRQLICDRPSDWIPELHDIPIGLVNKILYQQDEAEADIRPVIPKHTTHKYSIIHNQYNTFTDSADEMNEEEALALRKSRLKGKHVSISTKKNL